MLKVICIVCVSVVMAIIACDTGDALKVVARDGTVCGCMYDETGFHQCTEDKDTTYVVIEVSVCDR